jgi:hypothetical protein
VKAHARRLLLASVLHFLASNVATTRVGANRAVQHATRSLTRRAFLGLVQGAARCRVVHTVVSSLSRRASRRVARLSLDQWRCVAAASQQRRLGLRTAEALWRCNTLRRAYGALVRSRVHTRRLHGRFLAAQRVMQHGIARRALQAWGAHLQRERVMKAAAAVVQKCRRASGVTASWRAWRAVVGYSRAKQARGDTAGLLGNQARLRRVVQGWRGVAAVLVLQRLQGAVAKAFWAKTITWVRLLGEGGGMCGQSLALSKSVLYGSHTCFARD